MLKKPKWEWALRNERHVQESSQFNKIFAKTQLWKQWNKLKARSSDNMADDWKKIPQQALKHLENELRLEEDEEDKEEEDKEKVLCILN
jgi:hypothetical protein